MTFETASSKEFYVKFLHTLNQLAIVHKHPAQKFLADL